MPTSASPAASTIELWQRAQTVLARALKLPDSERHSLVDRECGSQDALAQYVRMMLDKNADPVDWLEKGVPLEVVSCSLLADGDVLGGRVGSWGSLLAAIFYRSSLINYAAAPIARLAEPHRPMSSTRRDRPPQVAVAYSYH